MSSHKTKLELTWVGKENQPRLEPRILIEDPAKSHHAPFRMCDKDLFDNRLIFGDNLLALKALEQEFAGKIKCIYKDFIYVTTQTLTREQVQKLSDEVGEGRSLLVMCGAFRVKNLDPFPNLTVKKIPKAVISRCEWGKDDYSLEIKSLPMKPVEEEPEARQSPSGKKPRTKAGRREQVQATLFDMDDDKRSKP